MSSSVAPCVELLLELGGAGAQLGVAELLNFLFERVDLVDQRPQPLQLAVVLGSDDFFDECTQHGSIVIREARVAWMMAPVTATSRVVRAR